MRVIWCGQGISKSLHLYPFISSLLDSLLICTFICFSQVNMKKDYQKKQMDKGSNSARATITLNAHQRKCVQGVLKEQWVNEKKPKDHCNIVKKIFLHFLSCLFTNWPTYRPVFGYQRTILFIFSTQGRTHCWHDEADQRHQEPFQFLKRSSVKRSLTTYHKKLYISAQCRISSLIVLYTRLFICFGGRIKCWFFCTLENAWLFSTGVFSLGQKLVINLTPMVFLALRQITLLD